ncbi:unnamed protein product [Paramecium primaurelia]|uniref:Uncharacterized protein n=1 Tax=Paramecium primaurelia TaxID=5886 RepID=A0A8S1LA72_PARPR|nr:unnamed protein product [Paramecium primaurelia]
MIEDDESECFFQLKPSKKIKKTRGNTLRIQKHYDTLNQMQIAASDQEQTILGLIDKRSSIYSKNKQITQWKENISQSQSLIYVNFIKNESETFDDSESFLKQPQNELLIENYLC